MKTANFLKLSLAGLCTLLLPLAASAQTVVEIDQPTLEGWIESGEQVTVPAGIFYQITLEGETTTLNPNTVFQVLDEEGEIRIVLVRGRPEADTDMDEEGDDPADNRQGPPSDRPADPQGKPPYDKLKPLPEEIVRENLNDISPS